MQIIPAIDIKDGHCVRLRQGDMHSATIFSEDPAAMAQHWLEQGAQRLHIVDLNGAIAGKPINELAIREIVSVSGEEIPLQLGGGIRALPAKPGEHGLVSPFVHFAAQRRPPRLETFRLVRTAAVGPDELVPERPSRLHAVVPGQAMKPEQQLVGRGRGIAPQLAQR